MVAILTSLPIWITGLTAITACLIALMLCFGGFELHLGKHIRIRLPGLRRIGTKRTQPRGDIPSSKTPPAATPTSTRPAE